MENFLFLLVVILLQLLCIKFRIELITIIISMFGIALAIIVISEIAYPLFNIMVIFICLANIYDLYLTRARR